MKADDVDLGDVGRDLKRDVLGNLAELPDDISHSTVYTS